MAEVPEIYALRRNHDDIVGAMSRDLDYFRRLFVQEGFIRSYNASNIMGLLGISASEKAGRLLDSFLAQISESVPQETRQNKFQNFVEIMKREATTEDLGNRILHSYENPKPEPRWRSRTRVCGLQIVYWSVGVGIVATALGMYLVAHLNHETTERLCAKYHAEKMDECLRLGETWGIRPEVLEIYRESGRKPEDVCLMLFGLSQEEAEENLSLDNELRVQNDIKFMETMMRIKKNFAESKKNNPACYDNN